MKMGNIASLDPAITSTGRSGLGHGSAAEKLLWDEMQSDWEHFAAEAYEATLSFGGSAARELDDTVVRADHTGTDRLAEVKVRVGQAFFRRAVLSAYNYRCCITGLAVPQLLVASHIVPWGVDPQNRLNPRNGLCLSALHDRAFDAGIISIAEDFTILISPRFRNEADPFFAATFAPYDKKPINLPERFRPSDAFLAIHRESVFQGSDL
jgi:predicted restriction endonuclease